jgi:tRNA threonylcarbamoyladenosine biosynthesis protein TsaE
LQKKKVTYSTTSDRETVRLGRRLGALLKPGDVVAVTGPLGSGKTWFAKGVGLGLGVPEKTVITSPSFALVNEYEGRIVFYHMDLYRLAGLEEVLASGLEEYLYDEGVAFVEWADRCPEILPARSLAVAFFVEGPKLRRVALEGNHLRANEILEALLRETGAP